MEPTTVQKLEKTSECRLSRRSKPYWKPHRWSILACVLILASLLLCLLQGLPSTVTQGRGEILLGEAATGNPPGYFCGGLFSVLSQFHFFVDTTSGPIPVIGVPPDYTKGQSKDKSGILTHTAQNELVSLFPLYDAQKKQAVFRYSSSVSATGSERICASNTAGKSAIQSILDQFYGYDAKKGTTGPSVNGTNDKTSLDPATWVTNAVIGLWDNLWKQIVTFIQTQVIDWCKDFGFIWITPAALSYKNAMVLSGAQWAVGALDGYIALLLVLGGYQLLMNRSLGLSERASVLGIAMRVIFAALIANTAFFLLLPSIVELSNSMSVSILAVMIKAAPGDVSLPLGAINWVRQPISWGLFIVVYFLISLLFIAVEAVRLAVLDVTIMFSPLWIMALSNEYSRAWGRFGALTFFSALFMQPIQVACIALGSAFITNYGHPNSNAPALCENMSASAHAACIANLGNASLSGSMNIIVLVLGIATLYIAIKIPGMLFSNALRASAGSVNRDIGHMVRSVTTFVFFQNQLGK